MLLCGWLAIFASTAPLCRAVEISSLFQVVNLGKNVGAHGGLKPHGHGPSFHRDAANDTAELLRDMLSPNPAQQAPGREGTQRRRAALPRCSDPEGSQHGWPVFQDESSLRANTSWANYFVFVYGEVPTTGYPICMWDFGMLYKNGLKAADINISSQLVKSDQESVCIQTGFLMEAGSEQKGTQIGDASYYWMVRGEYDAEWYDPLALVSTPMQALPDDHWAEVVHCAQKGEIHVAYYFHMPGSAVWLWMGKTKPYHKLSEIVKEMDVTDCPGWVDFNQDCDNGKVWSNAVNKGYNTLQIMSTCEWYCRARPQIIDLVGTGSYPCGRENTKLKAGWPSINTREHPQSISWMGNNDNDCSCTNTIRSCFNCAGVGHFGVGTSLLSFANFDTDECLYSLSAPGDY